MVAEPTDDITETMTPVSVPKIELAVPALDGKIFIELAKVFGTINPMKKKIRKRPLMMIFKEETEYCDHNENVMLIATHALSPNIKMSLFLCVSTSFLFVNEPKKYANPSNRA